MRSGVLYRLGMTVVIASALIGLWSLFFPDSLSSAMNAVGDLASDQSTDQSTTEEVAQSVAVADDKGVNDDRDATGAVDLRVEATDTAVNSQVRWAITVVNDGPDAEIGPITLRGTLPPSASYVSFSGRDWLCTELDDGALVCNLSSALEPGERAELILLADAAPGDDMT